MKHNLQLVAVAVLTLASFSLISLAQSGLPSRSSRTPVTVNAPIASTGIAGGGVDLSCTMATTSTAGCVSATTQTFSGAKTFDSTVASSVASGTNAFAVSTNGGRIDVGAGSLDYIDSDGTDIQFPGDIEFTATTTTGHVQAVANGSFMMHNIGVTAATLSTTTPAFQLNTLVTPDTNDVTFAVSHSALGTYDLAVFYNNFTMVQGLKIGLASADTDVISGTLRGTTTNPGACTASTCTDTAITVVGALSGAECVVGVPAVTPNAALMLSCFVSAAGTVQFRCCNVTAVNQTPAAGVYSVRVFNPN